MELALQETKYSKQYMYRQMYAFMLHRKAAFPRKGPKTNLTRNPLQHLAEKVPINKVTKSSYLIHIVASHVKGQKANPARNYSVNGAFAGVGRA